MFQNTRGVISLCALEVSKILYRTLEVLLFMDIRDVECYYVLRDMLICIH